MRYVKFFSSEPVGLDSASERDEARIALAVQINTFIAQRSGRKLISASLAVSQPLEGEQFEALVTYEDPDQTDGPSAHAQLT